MELTVFLRPKLSPPALLSLPVATCRLLCCCTGALDVLLLGISLVFWYQQLAGRCSRVDMGRSVEEFKLDLKATAYIPFM